VEHADEIRAKKSAKSCGHAAERLARDHILPSSSIGCGPLDGRSTLASSERVPFDVIAKCRDEFWLVEVKARSPDAPTVPDFQERRMLKLCRLLADVGITVVPKLLWIDHWGAKYELFDFPTTSRESAGADTDLPDLAERVADWVGRIRASHPT
jgi:hypothetical protein